jgi:hypothetical protein
MPTLEVCSGDVDCTHGATVADIDENEAFYLQSRGIGRREVRTWIEGEGVLGGVGLVWLVGWVGWSVGSAVDRSNAVVPELGALLPCLPHPTPLKHHPPNNDRPGRC